MPINITISSHQLHHAADVKAQIDALQAELSSLLGATDQPAAPRRRGMSAAGRARIVAAQRLRWSRFHTNGQNRAGRKPRRKMSPAVKAHLAAIARARWRRAKRAGKNAL